MGMCREVEESLSKELHPSDCGKYKQRQFATFVVFLKYFVYWSDTLS